VEAFCPKCGVERIGELRFCADCGMDLDKVAIEAGSNSDALSPEAKPVRPDGSQPSPKVAARRAAAARVSASLETDLARRNAELDS
jgi:uncharacterized Zn finger protein (UPF0148 family)